MSVRKDNYSVTIPKLHQGVSLVEILIAVVIIVLVSMPIISALQSVHRGTHVTARKEFGLYLGQAILEGVQYRLYVSGPELQAVGVDEVLDEAAYATALRVFFISLEEEGASITLDESNQASRYFASLENLKGTGLHGFSAERYPEIYSQLQGYRCELNVTTPSKGVIAGTELQRELAEIAVKISWPSATGQGRRSLELFTVVRVGGILSGR